jgi:hypothetical protein
MLYCVRMIVPSVESLCGDFTQFSELQAARTTTPQRPHLRAALRVRKNRGGALKWKFNSWNNLNCKIMTSARGAESEKEAAAWAKEQAAVQRIPFSSDCLFK